MKNLILFSFIISLIIVGCSPNNADDDVNKVRARSAHLATCSNSEIQGVAPSTIAPGWEFLAHDQKFKATEVETRSSESEVYFVAERDFKETLSPEGYSEMTASRFVRLQKNGVTVTEAWVECRGELISL